jgi:hypothetical protein
MPAFSHAMSVTQAIGWKLTVLMNLFIGFADVIWPLSPHTTYAIWMLRWTLDGSRRQQLVMPVRTGTLQKEVCIDVLAAKKSLWKLVIVVTPILREVCCHNLPCRILRCTLATPRMCGAVGVPLPFLPKQRAWEQGYHDRNPTSWMFILTTRGIELLCVTSHAV